ncbi:hypothetical protein [Campylobacter concisus]|nr:hypothetical protein [Campylobacter concisus]
MKKNHFFAPWHFLAVRHLPLIRQDASLKDVKILNSEMKDAE